MIFSKNFSIFIFPSLQGWLLKIKPKLISKAYKSVLTDVTRLGVVAVDARAAWNALADKAVGTILLYLS